MKHLILIILVIQSFCSTAQYTSQGHLISSGGKTVSNSNYTGVISIGEAITKSNINTTLYKGGLGYIYTVPHLDSSIVLNCKIYLEGFYDTTTQLMSSTLFQSGVLPTQEPYTNLGFFVSNSGISVSNNVYNYINGQQVVDWILVQALDNSDSIIVSKAVLLLQNGLVVEPNGNHPLVFNNVNSGSYKIKVKHRNHISVKTSQAIFLGSGATLIDFTNGSQILQGGNNAQNQLLNIWAAISADANSDDQVSNMDLEIWRTEVGGAGYLGSDFDNDGQSDNTDYQYFKKNVGKGNQ